MRVLIVWLALALFPAAAQNDAAAERARAWAALQSRLPEERYQRHSAAVEAIMREMAESGTDNRNEWGLAGLLHDLDIGETAKDLSRHGVIGAGWIRELGFSEAVAHAVLAHDDRPGVARTSRMDHAVYCADQGYWLVAAAGFVFGSEKLNSASVDDVWARAKETPSKQAILGQLTKECAAIGLSMPQMIAKVQAASRKLARQ